MGLFNKKARVEMIPNFDHDAPTLGDAIGIPNLTEITGNKLEKYINNNNDIHSPSRCVEALYNNFDRIELAVICAQLGRQAHKNK